MATESSSERACVLLERPHGKQAEDWIAGVGIEALALGLDALFRRAGKNGPFETALAGFKNIDKIDGRLLSALLELPAESEFELGKQAALCIARAAAEALFALTKKIYAGQLRKTQEFPDWSEADLQRIRGTRHFVIGGGISAHALGRTMIAGAEQAWREEESSVCFHRPKGTADAGALGSLLLVPPDKRVLVEER